MATIEIIREFAEWFNTARRRDIKPMNHHRYFYNVMSSFEDQFVSQSHRDYIGVSQLYHGLLFLGLKHLGFPAPEDSFAVRNAVTFHYGDIFEALIFELMRSQGIAVKNEQQQIKVNAGGATGVTVKGHIDGMVHNTLVEVKTMSDDYFKKFTKEPNDMRGYLTQLAMYHFYAGTDNACWICYNKQTNMLKIVEPYMDSLQAYHKIGLDKVHRLSEIVDYESLLDNANIPPPVPEVYKKENTGKFLPPKSFQGSELLQVFYNTYEGKNGYGKMKTYVEQEPKLKHEIIERLEELHHV